MRLKFLELLWIVSFKMKPNQTKPNQLKMELFIYKSQSQRFFTLLFFFLCPQLQHTSNTLSHSIYILNQQQQKKNNSKRCTIYQLGTYEIYRKNTHLTLRTIEIVRSSLTFGFGSWHSSMLHNSSESEGPCRQNPLISIKKMKSLNFT
uniref:Uncharacterized protein n=1 Tax=Cucumis melo TaxID=3656 RepID=A0A9I9E8H7_CUCME